MSTGGLNFKNLFRIFVLAFVLLGMSSPAMAALKVKKITFEGNRHFSNKQLKSIIKSREGKAFNAQFLKLDRTLLTNFYQRNGFLDAYVEGDFSRDGNQIFLLFRIREGRRYYLKDIEFIGNTLFDGKELRKQIPLKNMEPFQRYAVDEGLNLLENLYFNNGKPYVVITDSLVIESDSLIHFIVKIKENPTVYIREIDYQGLRWTKSFIIRRELEIKPGDVYSRQKIERSQRNIYSTGLFKFVSFKLIPLDSAQTQVRLLIQVVEKRPRWLGLQFGIAYEEETDYGAGTSSTLDFTAEVGHRNVFGTARAISLGAIPSITYHFETGTVVNPKNQVNFTFVEPWIGYTRTPGVLQLALFQYRRPVYSANINVWNASFKVTHDYENFWSLTGILAFQRTEVLAGNVLEIQNEIPQLLGNDRIYSFSVNLTRDHRDNYLNPTQGSITQFYNKVVYSVSRQTELTIINKFLKFQWQWNRYQPFPWHSEWTLASRLKIGTIVELGPRTQIPLIERFYLGGASSVRGYREQELGPKGIDENGQLQPLGGKMLILGNVELRIPIFWLFYGELFTDAGNVWRELFQLTPSEIKPSSGLGIALVTPIGPVRFDYGRKWFPEAGENKGEFHIGISFAF